MKRLLVYAIAVIVSSQCLWAGSDGMKVSVHVDGIRLEDLLTDEQKAGVTNLKITGSLAEEDYAYLRNSLFLQLDTLDLLDADIDTIPSNVFNWENVKGVLDHPIFRVVLPKTLRHLADYSLNMGDASIVFELTGPFPTLGKYVYEGESGSRSRIEPSADNVAYKTTPIYMYSTDGSVLYFADFNRMYESPQYGVRIIYQNAFEYCWTSGKLILPASVDSIGDRAFADFQMPIPTGHYDPPKFICEAVTPPRLGKDVFLNAGYDSGRPFEIYVPDESVELYRNADGWKDMVIWGILADIESVRASSKAVLDIDCSREAYILQADKVISHAACYNAAGQTIRSLAVCANSFILAKSEIPGPYMLVRIYFEDGTGQVVKLSR